MEITVNDFEAKYEVATKTFVMRVPQAVLIQPSGSTGMSHRPGTASESQTGAAEAASHQVLDCLTIRLSPNATWHLVEAFRLAAQLGRPIGEEPERPPSAKN